MKGYREILPLILLLFVISLTTSAQDTTAPVITLTTTTVNHILGEAYSDSGVTASDDIDGDLTANIVVGGDTVNVTIAGTYTITYNVSDAAGNPAIQKTKVVTVGSSFDITVGQSNTAFVNDTWNVVPYDNPKLRPTDIISASFGLTYLTQAEADVNHTKTLTDASGLFEYDTTVILGNIKKKYILYYEDALYNKNIQIEFRLNAGVLEFRGVNPKYVNRRAINFSVGDPVATYNRGLFQASAYVLDLITLRFEVDGIPPVITLTTTTVNHILGEAYSDSGVTASDDVDGDLTANIVVGGDTVNVTIAGTYTITYNVSDAAGNPAIQKTKVVTVASSFDITVGQSNTAFVNDTWNVVPYDNPKLRPTDIISASFGLTYLTQAEADVNHTKTLTDASGLFEYDTTVILGNIKKKYILYLEDALYNKNIQIEFRLNAGVLEFRGVNPQYIAAGLIDFSVGDPVATYNSASFQASAYVLDLITLRFEEIIPPVIPGSSPKAVSIAENATIATVVYDVEATDKGGAADVGITYSLSGTDASQFAINRTTGVITLTQTVDYETKTSYSFVVTASNAFKDTSTQTVAVTVTDVTDETAPVIPGSSSKAVSIAENAPIATVVYDVQATNNGGAADAGITYSLFGIDAGDFTITTDTGVITLKLPADFETKTSYSFIVLATNAILNSTDQRVTVTITDVDEIVPVISLTTTTVNHILGEAYSDSGVTASDAVDGDLTANIVVGGDAVNVTIAGIYTITYNVSDAAGNPAIQKTKVVTVASSFDITVGQSNTAFVNDTWNVVPYDNPKLRPTDIISASFGLTYLTQAEADVNHTKTLTDASGLFEYDTTVILGNIKKKYILYLEDGTYNKSIQIEFRLNAGVLEFRGVNPRYVNRRAINFSVGDPVATYNSASFQASAYVLDLITLRFEVDGIPPVISLTTTTVYHLLGEAYSDSGVTASDDVDGDLTANIVVGGDTVNVAIAGTYTITYNVSDAAGNPAIQKTKVVTVGSSFDITVGQSNTAFVNDTWNVVAYDNPKLRPADIISASFGLTYLTQAEADVNHTKTLTDASGLFEYDTTVILGNIKKKYILYYEDALYNKNIQIEFRLNAGVLEFRGVNPQYIAAGLIDFSVGDPVATYNNTTFSTSVYVLDLITLRFEEIIPPVIPGSSPKAVSIAENATIATVVYDVEATDGGAADVGIIYSLSGTDASQFVINSTTGVITLTQTVDYETKTSYSFVVSATGVFNNTSTQTVAVTVTDVTDETAPVIPGSSSKAVSIAENAPIATVVYDVQATNNGGAADAGITYSLFGIDAGDFTITTDTGVITLKLPADFETKTSYSFIVLATNAILNSTDQRVTVTITDVDEIVPVISLTTTTVNHILGEAYSDSGVTASDAVDGDLTANIVVGGDAVNVTIAGIYTITYNVSDAAGNPAIQKTKVVTVASSFDITVGQSNTAFVNDTWNVVPYDNPKLRPTDIISASFGLTNVTQAEADAIHTKTLTDASGLFEYDTTVILGNIKKKYILYLEDGTYNKSIQIEFRLNAGVLEFRGVNPRYVNSRTINFSVGDPVATYNSASFQASAYDLDLITLRFEDIIPPVIPGSSPKAVSIAENATIATVVYDVEATDNGGAADIGITYSLSGTDADLFAIIPATGIITLKQSADFETKSSYSFAVTATDASNASTQTVTVTVTDVDEVTLWTGVGRVQDPTDAANWSNGVPNSNSTVNIGATDQITLNTAITAETVNIVSGASLIAQQGITGTVNYTRNLATTNWYLISSPVKGQGIDAFAGRTSLSSGTGNNRGLASYNNAIRKWSYYQSGTLNSGVFEPGFGRSIKLSAPGDITFTGTFNSADASIPMTTNFDRLNLIGNPYISYISTSEVLTANNALLAERTIWMWNQAGNGYQQYNLLTAKEIAPAQGFFVSAKSSGNFSITEAMQNHTVDTFQKTGIQTKVELSVSNGASSRKADIFYIASATTGLDNGYDSSLFPGSSRSFELYTHAVANGNGEKLGIQALPNSNYETTIVPLGVKAVSGSSLSFSAKSINLLAGIYTYLEDKLLTTFTRIDTASYQVMLSSDLDGVGRFYLHTRSNSLSFQNYKLENVSVYVADKRTLQVEGIHGGEAKLGVYNILGKQLLNSSFIGTGSNSIRLPNLPTGTYLVKIQSEAGVLNKKIIIE